MNSLCSFIITATYVYVHDEGVNSSWPAKFTPKGIHQFFKNGKHFFSEIWVSITLDVSSLYTNIPHCGNLTRWPRNTRSGDEIEYTLPGRRQAPLRSPIPKFTVWMYIPNVFDHTHATLTKCSKLYKTVNGNCAWYDHWGTLWGYKTETCLYTTRRRDLWVTRKWTTRQVMKNRINQQTEVWQNTWVSNKGTSWVKGLTTFWWLHEDTTGMMKGSMGVRNFWTPGLTNHLPPRIYANLYN